MYETKLFEYNKILSSFLFLIYIFFITCIIKVKCFFLVVRPLLPAPLPPLSGPTT